MLFLLAVTLLVSAIAYYKWTRRHFNKCAATLPQDPGWPLIGNAWPFFQRWNETFYVVREIVKKYQETGMYAVSTGPFLNVLVWDADYVNTILSSNNAAWKGNLLKFMTGDLFDGVVVQSGGTAWSELKKPLNKLFTKKQLSNEYHDVFVDMAKVLTDFIRDNRLGKEYDVLPDCFHMCYDSLSRTHMGVHSNEINENKYSFLEKVDMYLDVAIPGVLNNPTYALQGRSRPGRTSQIKKVIADINDVLQSILDERRKVSHPKHGSAIETYPDFLIRRGREKNLPDSTLRKELMDVISAIESTGVLLSGTLLFMAMYPEIQERVYQEQLEVMGSDPMRDPSAEDLLRMEYLDRVEHESLRHVSPPGSTRKVYKDLQLGPYTLPKGALITVSADGLHNNPKYWDRPKEFYPDHFLPEKVAARPDLAFIPFGLGNRSCSGWKYSLIEVMVAVSFIVRNFKLSTTLKYEDLRYKYSIMRQIDGDVAVKFELRNND